MRDIMLDFYLSQKKYNKDFIEIYHVSIFFEFLIVIVSVSVSQNVTVEKIHSIPF